MNYHLTIEERACITKFKEMKLSKTNNNELKEKLDLLNNRPRKCINYKTPNELINEYIIQCCTWFDKLS